MRALNCDCGHSVSGRDDDELMMGVRRHVEEAHPDMQMSDDDMRNFIQQRAFDAA